jgi:hypothetical protein
VQTARQSIASQRATGTLLPAAAGFEALAYAWPEKGTLTMLAGRTGSLKSTFALSWALRMGSPCLYLSMDQQPRTMMPRAASAWLGRPLGDVKNDLRNGSREWYAQNFSSCNLSFAFGPQTMRTIGLEVDAYLEFWDRWPDIIVVDNLMDLDGDAEGYQAQVWAMGQLERLAAVTGASVWVLHHCGEFGDFSFPPPRSAITNKVVHKPELIYTLAYDGVGLLRVAVVKNRDNPACPDASSYVQFVVDTETLTVGPSRGSSWAVPQQTASY